MSRFTNGNSQLSVFYRGYDRETGVARFAVWINVGGTWRQLTSATTGGGSQLDVRQGFQYQWAVQATDGAGNRSPWAYSGVFVS
jgi:hypothetical protein